MPNVSGFQQTDGDLIKAFVEGGGVILAFGPQIPMSRSYERNELFGIEDTAASASHVAVTIKDAIGLRAKSASQVSVNAAPSALWKLKGARLIASFEDGSPAVTVNNYGKGAAIAIIPDAWTAARNMQQLTRDVLGYARSLRGGSTLVDIMGTNEETDMAVEQTADGFRVAVVNYNASELSIVLNPINPSGRYSTWVDLVNDKSIAATDEFLRLTLPAKSFRAIEYRKR